MLVGGAGRGAFASGGLPALYDWMTVLWVSLIPLALALAGSLSAMGVLGLVISVTELPRIAFMLLLVLLTTSHFRRIPQYSRPVTDCN